MTKKKNNGVFSLLVLVFLSLLIFSLSQEVLANNKVVLTEKTLVNLETVEKLNSNNISSFYLSVGNQVRFKVVEDVEVNRNVVIEAGAIAFGDIVNVDSSYNPLIREGLNIKVNSVEAVDGTKINLVGGKLIESRIRKRRIPLMYPLLSPILLFRGNDVTIPKNTEIDAEVLGIYEINIE